MSVPAAQQATELPDVARGREPDHLLERLQHLRTVVPVFAQELASARRQAAQLRVENRRLAEEVLGLQRHRHAQPRRYGSEPDPDR